MYRGISSDMGVNTTWFGADALKVVDLLTYSYLESNRPNLEEESIKYIDWHIKNAGSDREVFLPETKKAIYRRSQGNARMINRLCWECLNQGCLDGVKTITEELFSFVCKNLGPHLAN